MLKWIVMCWLISVVEAVHDTADVELIFAGACVVAIAAAYAAYSDQCDMSFFDAMVSGGWSDIGIREHLVDVGLTGNAKIVAFNVLHNRVNGSRGGTSKAGGSSSHCKEEPKDSASGLAIEMAMDAMSLAGKAGCTPELRAMIKEGALKKQIEAEGEAEMIEIDGLYARTLRSHGVGAKLRKAKMGEDPEGVFKTSEGTMKLTASDSCCAKKWTTEALYLTAYNAMVRQVTIDGKLYILKRLREMQEYAYRLPAAQRLPYLRRLWMDSETAIPAPIDANALELVQTEWAESLSAGMGGKIVLAGAGTSTGDGEVEALNKKLAEKEALIAKLQTSRPTCFVCGEQGHIGKMCKLKCEVCSTADRVYKKYGTDCSCKRG